MNLLCRFLESHHGPFCLSLHTTDPIGIDGTVDHDLAEVDYDGYERQELPRTPLPWSITFPKCGSSNRTGDGLPASTFGIWCVYDGKAELIYTNRINPALPIIEGVTLSVKIE